MAPKSHGKTKNRNLAFASAWGTSDWRISRCPEVGSHLQAHASRCPLPSARMQLSIQSIVILAFISSVSLRVQPSIFPDSTCTSKGSVWLLNKPDKKSCRCCSKPAEGRSFASNSSRWACSEISGGGTSCSGHAY